MLNLSLTAIERDGEHARWEVPADDPLWEGTGLRFAGPLTVEVDGRAIASGAVLLRVRFRGSVHVECRRCGAPVEAGIDEQVELLFEPLSDREAEELAGEVYPLPGIGDTLDVSEALREQVLLSVPDLVLCEEACRGLCGQCGADLNRAPCDCVPAAEPSPWDALRGIKFE
jgi:uncharacterized protein